MITDRSEVTNMIRAAKVQKNISWAGVATAIGQSKEWTTAGCLGQMAFNTAQAEKIGAIFGVPWPDGFQQGAGGEDRRYLRTFG